MLLSHLLGIWPGSQHAAWSLRGELAISTWKVHHRSLGYSVEVMPDWVWSTFHISCRPSLALPSIDVLLRLEVGCLGSRGPLGGPLWLEVCSPSSAYPNLPVTQTLYKPQKRLRAYSRAQFCILAHVICHPERLYYATGEAKVYLFCPFMRFGLRTIMSVLASLVLSGQSSMQHQGTMMVFALISGCQGV